jgi:hypothetical protein
VKVGLGLVVALLVLGLFLLPVVPIRVVEYPPTDPADVSGGLSTSVPASPMYAYFGVGAVYVPDYLLGHSYCLIYGSPDTMCGMHIQRMNQMMTPV